MTVSPVRLILIQPFPSILFIMTCPCNLSALKVEIRYLPDHMQEAYIFFDGKKYPIRQTNRVENGHTKRKNQHAIDYSRMEVSKNV